MNSISTRVTTWVLVASISGASSACSEVQTTPPTTYENSQNTSDGSWKAQVKEVLTSNQVNLSKIKINKYNHYHTFVVSFPHDPRSLATAQYFNHLYARLLVANQWHNYALRDDNDGLKIQINWNTRTKVMTTIFVPLENSLPDSE